MGAAANSASSFDNEWYRHNDASVQRTTLEAVTGTDGQRQAYILVYVLDETRPGR